MARDVSFLRRQLARAFINEAFRLNLNPPDWSHLSEAQANEYLACSVLSLRAELQFEREWAAHGEPEADEPEQRETSVVERLAS